MTGPYTVLRGYAKTLYWSATGCTATLLRAQVAGADSPMLALVLRPILAPIQTSRLSGTHLPAAVRQALRGHEHIRGVMFASPVIDQGHL